MTHQLVFAASCLAVAFLVVGRASSLEAQTTRPDRPDPNEIPVPEIKTTLEKMPGVDELPANTQMPDVLKMNDGRRVTTPEQWKQRREEMRHILEYYSMGTAPPPPGNVKGREIHSELVADGKVEYRLIHLTFGPQESLGFDVGIFTPTAGGPVPAVIQLGGPPPGATPLPRLPMGPTGGSDVLLIVGVPPRAATPQPASAPATRAANPFGQRTAAQIVATNPAIAHGFAYVTFNYNDCGEDTTLRNPDGSWAFRTTRFYPAYPGYDWGLLRGWAWGASRVVDYLQTDPAIDKDKLIITGVSRLGKGAMVAGAFDERIALVAPVASSGGGTPAFRFSGVGRGGKEGLSEMMRKYPNYWSSHLHEFWGQPEKLPFDQHFFPAMVAPRPFIALEGDDDQNVVINAVKQTWLGAQPAYELLGVKDRLGVSWAQRRHGMVQGDWDAMLVFADKYLLGKGTTTRFDQFPGD